MKFNMYSVKDELNNKFMSPMFVEDTEYSEPNAIRQFKSNINSIKLWKDNPDDFALYLVGKFDDEYGAEATPLTKIISGRSCIE